MASIRTTTSGAFQVRYRDPNGRQRARNFTRKTDATRFAAAVETDKVRGDWMDPRLGKVTFEEWADEWLGQLSHLKPKTRLDYEVTLRRHVLPTLATAPVGSIDRPTMKRFANDLVEGGAGPDVVRIAVQVARSVLGVAVDAGALKANPATALKLARPRKAEQFFLSPEEVDALAEAIAPPYDTLIRFAAYTGLRAGEIGALRVKRIDFLRGESKSQSPSAMSPADSSSGRPRRTRTATCLCRAAADELAAYLAIRQRPGGTRLHQPEGGAAPARQLLQQQVQAGGPSRRLARGPEVPRSQAYLRRLLHRVHGRSICRDASHGALIDHGHLRHLWAHVPGAGRRDYRRPRRPLPARCGLFVDSPGLAGCLGGSDRL